MIEYYKRVKCFKCDHVWKPKNPLKKPVSCPKCKRYDWFELRKNKKR